MKFIARQIVLVMLALLGGLHVANAQTSHRVDINKLSYGPADLTIHLGDIVQWRNNDPIAHTATANASEVGGVWEVIVPPGKSAEYQPTQVGSVRYYCRFHPNMKGNIIVLP
jgi:plastocyanin